MDEEFEVSELIPIIDKAWKGVRDDYRNTIWYKEAEIVASFYHHLRSNVKFKNISEKHRLTPTLEYNPKPRLDAVPVGKPRYPKTKSGGQVGSEFGERGCKFDLMIIKFSEDPKEYEEHFDEWRFSYWSIKHVPLVAMEFKYPAYGEKIDLTKLENLIKCLGPGPELCYFCFIANNCFIADKKPELPPLEKKENEEKFRIAYGSYKGKWKTVPLTCYRTLSEHEK